MHSTPLGRLLLALALAAGCGTTPNRVSNAVGASVRGGPAAPDVEAFVREEGREDAAGGEDGEAPAPVVSGEIVRVAGRSIQAAELLGLWLHRESPEVRLYLEELILERLVILEAARMGLTVDEDIVAAKTRGALEQIAAEVARGGSKLGIDEFIVKRLGLDPENYRRRVRQDQLMDLMAERCVRAWLLASERAEVRVIVLDEPRDLKDVQSALAAGRDFATLATEFSIGESGQAGGRIPPVVRSSSALARLAFATPVGQVGGPIFEGGQYLLLLIESRPEPVRGPWLELGPKVEVSLAQQAIEDPEFWQWKTEMLDRYEVDMTPFFGLVGEPLGEAP